MNQTHAMKVVLCEKIIVQWNFRILLREIVIGTSFLIFSYQIFINHVFSCLCDGVPVSNQRNLRNMSLLNVRFLGLLPRVECIPALIACIR